MFFNWRDANQYVIYKYGRGVKYGDTESKGQSGTRDKGGTWTRMLGWDSGLRRKESGRDRIMVSVVQSGNWTRGLGRRGGTRTQPYGLRVQRRVFSTACVKAHYLGDIVISRTTGDASTRRGKPLPRAFSPDKGTKWRPCTQATSCIN